VSREGAAAPLILHVVYRFSVGGLENGVVNLVNRMPGPSWRHAIVSLTEVDDEYRARICRDDVTFIALHKAPGHAFGLYPALYRLFRELRPSIVHTRNLAALETVVPAWAAGVPVRVHGEHGRDVTDLDLTSRRYRLVRRAYRPFVHHFVALSHELESYLRDHVGVPAARVTHIFNGVDTERFRPSPAGRASIPGCPFSGPGLFIVGTVGRMEAVKDPVNLARAFVTALSLAPGARERLRLVMVGDGPQRAEAERVVRLAGAGELAWFAGARADVPDILRGLDCFVLPSLAEGVSNTILEAMASGLPVVATRVGGTGDLMVEGMTGRLVPRANSAALASAMLGYFTDRAAARRHGKAGRQRAEQHFSLERMVRRYETLYVDLLRARTHGQGAGRRASTPHGAAKR
jgi:sugar transferase (PEP-CTERM/EpsH1 system associated)